MIYTKASDAWKAVCAHLYSCHQVIPFFGGKWLRLIAAVTVHLDVGRLCGTSMCHPSGGDGFEIDISQKLKNLAHLLGDEILAPRLE